MDPDEGADLIVIVIASQAMIVQARRLPKAGLRKMDMFSDTIAAVEAGDDAESAGAGTIRLVSASRTTFPFFTPRNVSTSDSPGPASARSMSRSAVIPPPG
jgi:hypothetical protein